MGFLLRICWSIEKGSIAEKESEAAAGLSAEGPLFFFCVMSGESRTSGNRKAIGRYSPKGPTAVPFLLPGYARKWKIVFWRLDKYKIIFRGLLSGFKNRNLDSFHKNRWRNLSVFADAPCAGA